MQIAEETTCSLVFLFDMRKRAQLTICIYKKFQLTDFYSCSMKSKFFTQVWEVESFCKLRGTQWICSSKYLFFRLIFAGWEIWEK